MICMAFCVNAQPEPYAVLGDSSTILTFYYDEKKAERNGMDVKPTTYTYENDEIKDLITPDWYDYRDNIKTVVFDDSFANCSTLTSTAFWFFGCINLTSISGINNLKTDNVTDMGYMFIGCESLANLDISGFNTSNVETFYAMFANCSSLRELDLTNFNTAKATHMNGMFFSCSELETIFVGEEWSTAHVTDGSDMFTDCNALVGWEGTRYDENRVDPAYAHVDGGTANPGYFTDKAAMESLRKMLFDMIAQLEMETSVCESLLESKDPERASTLWQDINSIKAAIVDVSVQTEESKTKPEFDECEKYIDVIAHKLNELRHEIENYNNTQEPDPYVDPDIDNSLVAYYPFNGNANDESGHGNNGEVIGHVELVTDRHGNPNGAYRFFGEPFNYISVPDKEILHLNKFTLSAWVYSDAEDYSYGYLINKGRDIEDGAYRLCVKSVGATNEYGGINDAYIEGNPQVGVWHMITGTVEGDQAKYYLDGVLMDERTLSNPFVYMNTEPLTLGMHYYAGVPDMWAYPLLGVLDDVRIYNRVMSSSEIKELYYQENENQSFATFDGLTAWVSGEATLDEAFVEVEGGREAAAQTIAAIVWKNTTPLTTDMLRGINNPNLLIYVEADSLAPQGFKNVVVNGVAKEIVLADATSGNNNWYSPQSFRAEKISYTRNFRQRTEVGISRGWESIALPFTVQTITHATQGLITPFGANGTKHFWLRGYSAEGLRRATVLEANTPYVISMPNDTEVYPYEYNLNGQVTFTAENTTVPATPSVEEMMVVRDLIIMVPTFQYIPVNEYTYAINVGQTRDSYPEGSVFAREFRELRPFEVYTTHGDNHGARPRNIRITAQPNEDITGIKNVENDEFEGDWFTIEGYKMQGEPQRKGIYIQNGKKVKK